MQNKAVQFISGLDNIKLANISSQFPNGGRYCLHGNVDELLHAMIIYVPPHTTYPLHKHSHSDEVYFLIEGELTIITQGKTTEKTRLRSGISEGFRSTIIKKNVWHASKSGPKGATFLEVRRGPFSSEKTTFQDRFND